MAVQHDAIIQTSPEGHTGQPLRHRPEPGRVRVSSQRRPQLLGTGRASGLAGPLGAVEAAVARPSVAAMRAGSRACRRSRRRGHARTASGSPTPVVSSLRPTSGRAASRLVGATPGCERLLVTPQPPARLRRASSSPNSPHAILDWR